jgi:hypothetical protein
LFPVEPLWSGSKQIRGQLFIVLADNSSGMNIRDGDASRTRGEILRAILTVRN